MSTRIGAGRGIGRKHALRLARPGANVVVNDSGGAVDRPARPNADMFSRDRSA